MIGWWVAGWLVIAAVLALGLGQFIRAGKGPAAPARATPLYRGRFDPVYPCRVMPTRHCPAIYKAVCGVDPCARFESDDEEPWLPEIG